MCFLKRSTHGSLNDLKNVKTIYFYLFFYGNSFHSLSKKKYFVYEQTNKQSKIWKNTDK